MVLGIIASSGFSEPLARATGVQIGASRDNFILARGETRMEGGYRVSGRWSFGSGCQESSWLLGSFQILDGGQPRRTPDGTSVYWRDINIGGNQYTDILQKELQLTFQEAEDLKLGRGGGPERTMVVVFEYEGGAVGTLYHSWEIGSPLKGLRLSAIHGTEGAITFESNGAFVVVRGRGAPRVILPGFRDIRGYQAMYRDFADAIRTGRVPEMSLERAIEDQRLMDQVYATADARP